MNPESTNNPVGLAWPFWVLEIGPSDDSKKMERSYKRLENSLKLSVEGAEFYQSPRGCFPRDEFLLREARSILLDPEKRILAEYWYLDPKSVLQSNDKDVAAQDWKKLLKV